MLQSDIYMLSNTSGFPYINITYAHARRQFTWGEDQANVLEQISMLSPCCHWANLWGPLPCHHKSLSYTIVTTILPVARPSMQRTHASSAFDNGYVESMIVFNLPSFTRFVTNWRSSPLFAMKNGTSLCFWQVTIWIAFVKNNFGEPLMSITFPWGASWGLKEENGCKL